MVFKIIKYNVLLWLIISILHFFPCNAGKADDQLPSEERISTHIKASKLLIDQLQQAIETKLPNKHTNIAIINLLAKKGNELIYKPLPYFFVSGWGTKAEFELAIGESLKQYLRNYISSQINFHAHLIGYEELHKHFLNYEILTLKDIFSSVEKFKNYLDDIQYNYQEDESFAKAYFHSEQAAISHIWQNQQNICQDADIAPYSTKGILNIMVTSSWDVCEKCCQVKDQINKKITSKSRINLYDKTNISSLAVIYKSKK